MKSKCWLTMVCWALVCLVLGLIQQAGMYHSSQVSGSSQWLDRCREPASGSPTDRKSTRLNSSHRTISYAVFCLKKKKTNPHLAKANSLQTRHPSPSDPPDY